MTTKKELPINANICEPDDTYYTVRLEWLPRPGDLIDLYSFLETAKKRPPKRFYKVEQVVHKLYDVTETGGQSHKGHHFVTVHVTPARSKFFRK